MTRPSPVTSRVFAPSLKAKPIPSHGLLESFRTIHIELSGEKPGEEFHDGDLLAELPKTVPRLQSRSPPPISTTRSMFLAQLTIALASWMDLNVNTPFLSDP